MPKDYRSYTKPAGNQTVHVDDGHLLTKLLAVDDFPCPVCGANLRGTDSPRCPACTAQLELRVGSIDLKLAPWTTGLIGACTALGFVGVAALISTIGGLVDWSYDWGDWITVIGFWLLALLMAGVVGLIVRRRRRFVLIRVRRQWWLAAACVALVLPAVAGVFLLLFFVAWR